MVAELSGLLFSPVAHWNRPPAFGGFLYQDRSPCCLGEGLEGRRRSKVGQGEKNREVKKKRALGNREGSLVVKKGSSPCRGDERELHSLVLFSSSPCTLTYTLSRRLRQIFSYTFASAPVVYIAL